MREVCNRAFADLHAAPVFPSLVSEGREGGYDVHLGLPGNPLYLQFKIADHMIRASARHWHLFGSPFYRFQIRPSHHSQQHALLLGVMDQQPNAMVFYAASVMDSRTIFNRAFENQTVLDHSVFVDPHDIGDLDDSAHDVVFQPHSQVGYLCSDPRPVVLFQGGESFGRTIAKAIHSREPIDPDDYFKKTAEFLRRFSGLRSTYGDVADRTLPKKREWRRESASMARTVLEAELFWLTSRADSHEM